MNNQQILNKSPRYFVGHGALLAAAMAAVPLPLPEVTYVDWSEWIKATQPSPKGLLSESDWLKLGLRD